MAGLEPGENPVVISVIDNPQSSGVGTSVATIDDVISSTNLDVTNGNVMLKDETSNETANIIAMAERKKAKAVKKVKKSKGQEVNKVDKATVSLTFLSVCAFITLTPLAAIKVQTKVDPW